MQQPPLEVTYDGVEIDYAAFTTTEDRNHVLLDIAQREGLLERLGLTPDSHYAVLCNSTHLLITADEVPAFVLALHVAAGKPIGPICYRHGLGHTAVTN